MVRALRPVWAEVDLGHVRHNVARLSALARPGQLCAVVKANGYGHGAVPVARAALEGGATWLGVALVEEGVELRDAGIEAPILVLSEPPHDAMDEVVGRRLTPTIYTEAGVEAAAKAVAVAGVDYRLNVHVKVDTGMHRVGAPPEAALGLADAVNRRPELRLAALWTHLAVADEPDNEFTAQQLERFERVRTTLQRRGVLPDLVHAANSAALIAHPASRYNFVRCGIAIYGIDPDPALAGRVELRPAMSLKARVSFVKEVPAGDRISYGLRYELDTRSVIATVPVGYADGVTRRLSFSGGEVLVGERRRPIAGTVTMDQIMVDCGPDADVAAGDEVVLIGRQGSGRITAQEWADRLETIAYEVVCGIGPRVPRVYV
ncbi:MAG: alanine racemase [Acidimicrobiia bacterium]|nr:alanine racemase [Acidimicrobiia bacterium]